jgi:hypothetical protein
MGNAVETGYVVGHAVCHARDESMEFDIAMMALVQGREAK